MSPTTTTPPDCDAISDRYLEAFFAVGAGTPSDATSTTVVLPLGELRSIQAEASASGCSGFRVVVCSAWAQLDADGLTAQIDPPHCPS